MERPSEPAQLAPVVPARGGRYRRLAVGLTVLVVAAVTVGIHARGGELATHLESAEGTKPAPVTGLDDPSTSTTSPPSPGAGRAGLEGSGGAISGSRLDPFHLIFKETTSSADTPPGFQERDEGGDGPGTLRAEQFLVGK